MELRAPNSVSQPIFYKYVGVSPIRGQKVQVFEIDYVYERIIPQKPESPNSQQPS